jgi:hypothetical protein
MDSDSALARYKYIILEQRCSCLAASQQGRGSPDLYDEFDREYQVLSQKSAFCHHEDRSPLTRSIEAACSARVEVTATCYLFRELVQPLAPLRDLSCVLPGANRDRLTLANCRIGF